VGACGSGRGWRAQALLAPTSWPGSPAPSPRPQYRQNCFDMFNPSPGPAYRDAVSRWVLVLLFTLQHAANASYPLPSPHPLPGTVLAGEGGAALALRAAESAAGRRRLLGVAAEAEGAADVQAGLGELREEAARSGRRLLGRPGAEAVADEAADGGESLDFEARLRAAPLPTELELRQHSVVVGLLLLAFAALYVPTLLALLRPKAGERSVRPEPGLAASGVAEAQRRR
jgi:hypothetical protein